MRGLWHLAFAQLVTSRAPACFEVQSEVRLSIEPARADILLLRRKDVPQDDRGAALLPVLWPLLGRVTILEFKSPSRSSLRAGDLLRLFAYGFTYDSAHTSELPERADLSLVLVLPQITPTLRKEVERLGHAIDAIGGGYFRLVGAPYAAYIVVTDEVSAAEHDEFLQLFSHRLPKPGTAISWFGTFAAEKVMKNPEMKEEFDQDEALRNLARMFPVEFWMEGVPPEEICRRLTVQQLLAGLTPEKLVDLVAHLPPEVLDAAKKRSS